MIEVFQEFTEYAKQIIRIYNNKKIIEIEHITGPLPRDTQLITRFHSKIKSNLEMFSDSNGLEMMKRVKKNTIISGNYYPMVYSAFIKDPNAQLTV